MAVDQWQKFSWTYQRIYRSFTKEKKTSNVKWTREVNLLFKSMLGAVIRALKVHTVKLLAKII